MASSGLWFSLLSQSGVPAYGYKALADFFLKGIHGIIAYVLHGLPDFVLDMMTPSDGLSARLAFSVTKYSLLL